MAFIVNYKLLHFQSSGAYRLARLSVEQKDVGTSESYIQLLADRVCYTAEDYACKQIFADTELQG